MRPISDISEIKSCAAGPHLELGDGRAECVGEGMRRVHDASFHVSDQQPLRCILHTLDLQGHQNMNDDQGVSHLVCAH